MKGFRNKLFCVSRDGVPSNPSGYLPFLSVFLFFLVASSQADPDELAEQMRQGYLWAEEKSGTVAPGPRFNIHHMEVESHHRDRVAGWEYPVQYPAATSENIRAIENHLLEYAVELGFPFAEVRGSFKDYQQRNDTLADVTLVLELDFGKAYFFGGLQAGGSKTKLKVIQRLSLLERGQPFDPRVIRQVKQKLARSGYFRSVEEGPLYRDSSKLLLYPSFVLEDERNNQLSGLLGYSNEDQGREGLIGNLDIELKNILGTARDLSFHFLNQEALQEVDFMYTEPWLFQLPVGASLLYSVYFEDSSYQEDSWGVQLFQQMDYHSKYILSYKSQNNRTLVLPEGPGRYQRSEAIFTGLSLVLDFRDAVPYTQEGGDFNLGLQGIRRTTGDSVRYLAQPTGSGEWWWRFSRFWGAHFKLASGASLPLETSLENRGNLFLLGGAKTVRGYLEKSFLTNLYLYQNWELLFRLNPRNRFLIFVDPAFINRGTGDVYWRRVMGYGLGLELGSRDWVFGITYGLNLQRDFSEGVLHFTLSNRF